MECIIIKISPYSFEKWEEKDYIIKAAEIAKSLQGLFHGHTAMVASIENAGFIIKIPTLEATIFKGIGDDNLLLIKERVKSIFPDADVIIDKESNREISAPGKELSLDILIQGFRR